MNRRAFLASLGAAAFVAPDAERLLWRPGARTISIPAPRVIAPEAFRALETFVTVHAAMTFQRAYNDSFNAWRETIERGARVRVLG